MDTMLERGFDWYLSETYEVPGLRLGEEFSLVKIDLASRMLGKNYYYWEAKFSSSGFMIRNGGATTTSIIYGLP